MTQDSVTLVLFAIVVFFSAFEQTLTGFGFSLLVMPIATIVFGLQTSAPLVALIAITLYTVNVFRYKSAINARETVRLGIAAALGVPFGVWALANVNASMVKLLLGLILTGYAVYSFAKPIVSRPISERWVLLAGFISGCLGGAYNTPGPPVIVYGSMRNWAKDEFRAVLQAIFFLTASLSIATHIVTQHMTFNVLAMYGIVAPAVLVGILLAARVDAYVNKERFRTLVTWMIFVLGVSMMFDVMRG